MQQTLTVELDADTNEQLLLLAQSLGFPKEAAAEYAIRLVCACVREGLIKDVPHAPGPRKRSC